MAESNMSDRYLAAIDCSLCSPGVCVVHEVCQHYTCYGWSTTPKTIEAWKSSETAAVDCCRCFLRRGAAVANLKTGPQLRTVIKAMKENTDFASEDERLEYVSEQIVLCIEQQVRTGAKVRVAYEELPLHMQPGIQTSSMSGLRDVLAITRNKCFRRGWQLLPLNNSTIKRLFSGHGNATKPDMHQAFLRWWAIHQYSFGREGVVPALERRFWGLPDNVVRIDTKRTEWVFPVRNGNSHPLQDMVDAFALARVVQGENQAAPKRKRRAATATATATDKKKKTKEKEMKKTETASEKKKKHDALVHMIPDADRN